MNDTNRETQCGMAWVSSCVISSSFHLELYTWQSDTTRTISDWRHGQSLVLSHYFGNAKVFGEEFWPSKRVIELGSGTGIVGMTPYIHPPYLESSNRRRHLQHGFWRHYHRQIPTDGADSEDVRHEQCHSHRMQTLCPRTVVVTLLFLSRWWDHFPRNLLEIAENILEVLVWHVTGDKTWRHSGSLMTSSSLQNVYTTTTSSPHYAILFSGTQYIFLVFWPYTTRHFWLNIVVDWATWTLSFIYHMNHTTTNL